MMPTPPKSALVVDDDDFVSGVVAQMLRRQGLDSVNVAANGQQAAELLRRDGAVDLIVCDLMMPASDGLELMHDIALFSRLSRLIVMSSADERVRRTACEVASGHGLSVLGSLGKPITPAALTALLRKPGNPPASDAVIMPAVTMEELTLALAGDQFQIVVQPQLCLRTGRIVGAEALVRWLSPTRGTVTPDNFLPAVSRAGLMPQLTEVVLRAAIACCAAWHRSGLDVRISINFEAATLADRELPQRIVDLCRDADLLPSRVVAEVTENGLFKTGADPLEVMARLRLRDIELSIDDFGMGYSTLDRLQKLPFTEFKIDRQFVSIALGDQQARAIVESSILLAQKLGLRSVAEGIETEADYALMAKLGCDVAQGYYIARPMAPEQFATWSAGHHCKACPDTEPPCPFAHDCKLSYGEKAKV